MDERGPAMLPDGVIAFAISPTVDQASTLATNRGFNEVSSMITGRSLPRRRRAEPVIGSATPRRFGLARRLAPTYRPAAACKLQ
jgi:hypothetical protein